VTPGRTHNIVINEEKKYAVAVGAQPRTDKCASGLIFIDLTNPAKPTSPGCAAQDGYVHDAQCIVYRGPDKAYVGRDICYAYNEDTLTMLVHLLPPFASHTKLLQLRCHFQNCYKDHLAH
jgi:hypothetical protein